MNDVIVFIYGFGIVAWNEGKFTKNLIFPHLIALFAVFNDFPYTNK